MSIVRFSHFKCVNLEFVNLEKEALIQGALGRVHGATYRIWYNLFSVTKTTLWFITTFYVD